MSERLARLLVLWKVFFYCRVVTLGVCRFWFKPPTGDSKVACFRILGLAMSRFLASVGVLGGTRLEYGFLRACHEESCSVAEFLLLTFFFIPQD